MLVVRSCRVALVVLLGIVSVGACAEPSSEDGSKRAASVYSEVVRWFADRSADDPDPLPVFVEPRGEGASVPLGVQADLVNDVKDVADVRFIDTRDEALVEDDQGRLVVADDGLLVRLSPVVEDGDRVFVDVDVHDVDDEFRTMQFDVRRSGDRWKISATPDSVPQD